MSDVDPIINRPDEAIALCRKQSAFLLIQEELQHGSILYGACEVFSDLCFTDKRIQAFEEQYRSDLVLKYQKRFLRYKESLFTFLKEDGIPWHNNTAERAIRPFAIQRDTSKSPLHESATPHYVVSAELLLY